MGNEEWGMENGKWGMQNEEWGMENGDWEMGNQKLKWEIEHFLHQGNSLVLHCASLLRTIFASSARAHERLHVQNVRDFIQTKLDNGINSPFLLNEHGDPPFFFRYFLSAV